MPSRVRIATKKGQRSALPEANATKKVQRSSLPDTVADDGVFVVVREESGGGFHVIRRSDTTSKKLASKLVVGDTVSFQADGQENRAIILLIGKTYRLFIYVRCSFSQFR